MLAAACSAGIPLLTVDTNPVNYYPADAPVAETARVINASFGGSTEVAILIEGDILDPAVLNRIDALERDLGQHPHVGYTMSIARVLRKMNRAVSGDAPDADRIPATREAVAQLFLLYGMGGSPEDFERLVDFDYEHALVTVRVNSLSTEDIRSVVERARADTERDFVGIPVIIGGFGVVFSDLVDAVVQRVAILLRAAPPVVDVREARSGVRRLHLRAAASDDRRPARQMVDRLRRGRQPADARCRLHRRQPLRR
jgi:hypothetical protein